MKALSFFAISDEKVRRKTSHAKVKCFAIDCTCTWWRARLPVETSRTDQRVTGLTSAFITCNPNQYSMAIASSSREVISDEVKTTHYAQQATLLLQSISTNSSLPRIQSLQAISLQQSLPLPERKAIRTQSTCSFCGAIMIPGWNGSMQLSTIKPGRRKRKRMMNLDNHEEQRTSSLQSFRNEMLWKCNECARMSTFSGSDPNTKARYRPVKRQKSWEVLMQSHTQFQSKVEGPSHNSPKNMSRTTTALSSVVNSALSSHSPIPSPVPPAHAQAAVAVAVPSWKQTNSTLSSRSDSSSPAPAASNNPSLSRTTTTNASGPPTKKKRTKKEGLQAMLQAKKEQEERERKASSSLGLSSFLKGLQ